jgi:hypothetical protein
VYFPYLLALILGKAKGCYLVLARVEKTDGLSKCLGKLLGTQQGNSSFSLSGHLLFDVSLSGSGCCAWFMRWTGGW